MAVLDGVAHRDNLHLWHLEHCKHLSESLRPAADVRQGNLLAGRNKSRSAEHVPRHNGESRGGRAALENELAPGKPLALALCFGWVCLHKEISLERATSMMP